MPLFPQKLRPGFGIRIIAPSCSMSSMQWLTDEYLERVERRFADMGLTVTYGKHIREMDVLQSSSIESRLEDLHDAVRDPSVHAIIAIRGGFNSNTLLKFLDYDLIRKNPKILCGFSDITALQNAIVAKTGLVTYSGPSYYAFGYGEEFEYTLDYWKKCLMEKGPMMIAPSDRWTNDRWSANKTKLFFKKNTGYWTLQEGKTEGMLLGGNLCTLNLLHGTEFMPDLRDSVLFLEDDHESLPHTFDRDLQSLIDQPGFDQVCGLVIGRFQPASKMTEKILRYIINAKKELRGLPIVANVDFGHTQPLITFPIGGRVRIAAEKAGSSIIIVEH